MDCVLLKSPPHPLHRVGTSRSFTAPKITPPSSTGRETVPLSVGLDALVPRDAVRAPHARLRCVQL